MASRDPEKTAAPLVPAHATLPALREAAAGCRACDLWERGTQTVFGAGRVGARILFIGEQPGDEEDRAGEPFIGPAGRMLDRALADVGIDRRDAYVTNAVKHFKWVPRGKRRIHEKPNRGEVRACQPWLLAEIAAVRPEIIVCLGATAAQSLLGPGFRVTRMRGRPLPTPLARWLVATVHPSAILRAPDEAARREQRERFFDDLRAVRDLLLEPERRV